MIKDILKKIFNVIGILILCSLLLAGFMLLFNKIIQDNEQIECDDWKQQEADYSLWYSVNWQRNQCKQFGVFFDR